METFQPNQGTVKTGVEESLNKLIRNDIYLFEIGVHERTLAHRLAIYLEEEFASWNVDCEYDRNQYDQKLISRGTNGEADGKVYPDIIIHHRGTFDNLLAIEIKKSQSVNGQAKDERKLREYINRLGYRYGLFICFSTGRPACGIDIIKWITN